MARDHIRPQFYLRNFSIKEAHGYQVEVLNTETRKWATKPVKDVEYESDYYPGPMDKTLEWLEGKAARHLTTLRKLRETLGTLDLQEQAEFACFIASLLGRDPRLHMEAEIRFRSGHGRGGEALTEFTKMASLVDSLNLGRDRLVVSLLILKWTYYTCSPSDCFITSDCPVLLKQLCGGRFRSPLLTSLRAELLFPLARNMALVGSVADDPTQVHLGLLRPAVAELNREILIYSTRCYSSRREFPVVKL